MWEGDLFEKNYQIDSTLMINAAADIDKHVHVVVLFVLRAAK